MKVETAVLGSPSLIVRTELVFQITYDKSAVSLPESGEMRYVKSDQQQLRRHWVAGYATFLLNMQWISDG